MREGFISRGFGGRRRGQATKLPPGQYLEDGFPVLSAGPTPRTPLEAWDFSVVGEVDEPRRWTWEEFKQLPSEEITRTSTASPSGRSWAPGGRASPWIRCWRGWRRRPSTSQPTATATTRPTCP